MVLCGATNGASGCIWACWVVVLKDGRVILSKSTAVVEDAMGLVKEMHHSKSKD